MPYCTIMHYWSLDMGLLPSCSIAIYMIIYVDTRWYPNVLIVLYALLIVPPCGWLLWVAGCHLLVYSLLLRYWSVQVPSAGFSLSVSLSLSLFVRACLTYFAWKSYPWKLSTFVYLPVLHWHHSFGSLKSSPNLAVIFSQNSWSYCKWWPNTLLVFACAFHVLPITQSKPESHRITHWDLVNKWMSSAHRSSLDIDLDGSLRAELHHARDLHIAFFWPSDFTGHGILRLRMLKTIWKPASKIFKISSKEKSTAVENCVRAWRAWILFAKWPKSPGCWRKWLMCARDPRGEFILATPLEWAKPELSLIHRCVSASAHFLSIYSVVGCCWSCNKWDLWCKVPSTCKILQKHVENCIPSCKLP